MNILNSVRRNPSNILAIGLGLLIWCGSNSARGMEVFVATNTYYIYLEEDESNNFELRIFEDYFLAIDFGDNTYNSLAETGPLSLRPTYIFVIGNNLADEIEVRFGSASRPIIVSCYGGGGDDIITNNSSEYMSARGNSGDDTITAGNVGDDLWGDDGNDILTGGDGPDFIEGGNDSDTIVGGEGNDVLLGGFGWDMVSGEGGNDTVSGCGIPFGPTPGDYTSNYNSYFDGAADFVSGGTGSDFFLDWRHLRYINFNGSPYWLLYDNDVLLDYDGSDDSRSIQVWYF